MSKKDTDELSDSLLSSSSCSSTECSICLESLETDDIAYMDCGHSYHFRCIGSWMHHKNYHEIPCPLCNNIDGEIVDIQKGKKMPKEEEKIYNTIEPNSIEVVETNSPPEKNKRENVSY